MDSLTQITLGAAVGELVMGPQMGRKAALWGAVLGTLPDLDVFVLADAVSSFTEHRSFSHSLLVQLLLTPIFIWLIRKIHPSVAGSSLRWFFFVYLCLATHSLLDAFTVYGTQLLWPLTNYPFGLGSVFIIDPLYTVPLLLLLLVTIFTRARRPVVLGLMFSSAYLCWSVGAQQWQHQRFERSWQNTAAAQSTRTIRSMTLPMPLNTLLWKHIVVVDDTYWIGFSSIFDSKIETVFKPFSSEPQWLNGIRDNRDVQRLQQFTKGFYTVQREGDEVLFSDLRMGGYGRFVFNFKVGEIDANGQTSLALPITNQSNRPSGADASAGLKALWSRIWSPQTDLFQFFPK